MLIEHAIFGKGLVTSSAIGVATDLLERQEYDLKGMLQFKGTKATISEQQWQKLVPLCRREL
eukprot:scaffold311812_cov26-Tisochrysis_lutea.AAC.1